MPLNQPPKSISTNPKKGASHPISQRPSPYSKACLKTVFWGLVSLQRFLQPNPFGLCHPPQTQRSVPVRWGCGSKKCTRMAVWYVEPKTKACVTHPCKPSRGPRQLRLAPGLCAQPLLQPLPFPRLRSPGLGHRRATRRALLGRLGGRRSGRLSWKGNLSSWRAFLGACFF